jgi:ribosomal protein S5
MGRYIRAVSGKGLDKHVPTARQERNNKRAAFSMWSVPRGYKHGTSLELSSVQESVKRGLKPGGRGVATVEAVARKRLVTD